MSRPYRLSIDPAAFLDIERERTWLHNHRGQERADAFEAELRHICELLLEHPRMGDASPYSEDERHWLLRRSRCHLYYQVLDATEEILLVELQPEAKQVRRW